jgi:hypothetical protein
VPVIPQAYADEENLERAKATQPYGYISNLSNWMTSART